ncbi:MAG: hypothetical protein R3241_00210 [Rheinheimera sp.]|jgi:hypothetical protein|nr:hypothetical protein [Rheinheimera sp.]
MSISQYMPLFMTMMAPQEQRDEMMQMTLPTVMPLSGQLRGAMSAMAASNVANSHAAELRRQASRTATEAAAFAKVLAENGDLNDEEIKQRFPALHKYRLAGQVRNAFGVKPAGEIE